MKWLASFVIVLLTTTLSYAGWYYSLGKYCEDGTYEIWWNGEYPGDTDKACTSSGTASQDATDVSGGVLVVGGAIDGSFGALLDAADEHVRWASPDNTLETEATVVFDVTTPSSFSGDSMFMEFYISANDSIIAYFQDSDDNVFLRRRAQSNTDTVESASSTITVSTTHTIKLTWRTTATEAHCIDIDGGGWDCDEEDLDDFGAASFDIAIGDDQTGLFSINGSWKIDNFRISGTYQDGSL